jgi:hypothetical protein
MKRQLPPSDHFEVTMHVGQVRIGRIRQRADGNINIRDRERGAFATLTKAMRSQQPPRRGGIRVKKENKMTDQEHFMPWSRNQMTPEKIREWIASRKAAGEAIDIETCELGNWYINEASDPYDDPAGGLPEDDFYQLGKGRFVRSLESNGWVNECDLPIAKFEAMYARLQREAAEYKRSQASSQVSWTVS